MPIYEYACQNCGHTLDALQKMSDDPLVDCPECDQPALKKKLSAPRFRLKGQGWYETDFKKDNQRNLSSSDGDSGKSDSKSDKSGEKKSDSSKKETKSKASSSKSD